MTGLGNRIHSLRNEKGLNQSDYARIIGVKRSATISSYENDQSEPPITVIRKIAEIGSVDLNWLLTGEGPKYIKTVHEKVLNTDNSDLARAPSLDNLENQLKTDLYAYLPLYDMSASAGGGFCATDQEEVKTLLAFKKDWIHAELLVNPEELFLVHVEGESMIPVLNPGDVILVKKQNGAPIKDGIHVVRLGDVILVKRVQRLPEDKIKISSDNKAYEPYTLDLAEMDNFAVIGRVVWAGRRF